MNAGLRLVSERLSSDLPLFHLPISTTQTPAPFEGPEFCLCGRWRTELPTTKKEKGHRHEHLLWAVRLLDSLRTRARGGNPLRLRAGMAFLQLFVQGIFKCLRRMSSACEAPHRQRVGRLDGRTPFPQGLTAVRPSGLKGAGRTRLQPHQGLLMHKEQALTPNTLGHIAIGKVVVADDAFQRKTTTWPISNTCS